MKLLFVSGNLTDGGAQRVISVAASALAGKGHDVSVLVFARNEKEYPLSDKVKLVSLADSFEDYSAMSHIKRIKLIRRHLKEFGPDVAVGFMEGGYALYFAAAGMKLKRVSSARIDPEKIFGNKSIRGAVDRRWFYASDAVVLQVQSQLDRVPEKLKKKSVVIPNPVSERATGEDGFRYNEKCRHFVMAGRMSPQKNYAMMLSAAAKLKDRYPGLRVDVFGKGRELEALEARKNASGLEGTVFFRGWTTDTVGEYLDADAYILSSNYEGMPNALAEAMAIGMPVISTDCPTGPGDMIEDGVNGFLIPVGDADALADRMERYMNMTADERAAIGTAARRTVLENYTAGNIADKWEKLFAELTCGKERCKQ